MTEWEWQEVRISKSILNNKFIVIIPCFNAEETITKAILSVLYQDFFDLGVIIRNDQSTDQTADTIRNIFGITEEGDFHIKSKRREIIYIENQKKFYGGGNTYDSVIKFVNNPYSIIGVVDGDDFLLPDDAVSTLYNIYQYHPEKWLIWSQHVSREQAKMNFTGYSKPLPPDQIIYSTRKYWAISHFRTCLAGLFHLIDPVDLADPNNPEHYTKICGDAAFIYPITELCGNHRSLFVDKLLYYYTDGISTNDFQVYREEIEFYRSYFENKLSYPQLSPDFKF